MSADSTKIRDTFVDQLSTFDDRLHSAANDVDMLADIQEGIGSLLSQNGGSEAEIRRVLQERYDAGELRTETFQLVKSMLDHYVTEDIPTSPLEGSRSAPAKPTASAKPSARATPVVDIKPPKRVAREPSIDKTALESHVDDAFSSTAVLPAGDLPTAVNDAESRVQVGSVLRDRFLLQKKISGGSMGVVYKALDRRLAEAGSEQTSVAIKILSPNLSGDGNALRALQQEAAKTRCLVHPHIVRFIDLDRDDDLYFLILEWLEGRTLADILDSPDARSIDAEAALRIVRQVGEALDYAHRCGIVHADVKPANIMMLPNGDAKLFDFGVARVRQKQNEADFDPGVLGALTPAYSSMQVLGGEEPVATDDVFSLGCLMYRLIAGYRVFGPRNAAEASEEGMKAQPPQGMDDARWKVLRKALSYSRVTRFNTIREFLDALDKAHNETVTFEAPKRIDVEPEGSSPGKWIAIVLVLLGLGGIGAQQMGYLDPWLDRIGVSVGIVDVPEPVVEDIAELPDPLFGEDAESAETETGQIETATQEVVDPLPDAAPEVPEETVVEETPEPVAPESGLVDFSQLPPPTALVSVTLSGPAGEPTRVRLREDGDPVTVDFVRSGDTSAPLTLRLEEVGFSGNRSPWGSGQYALSNSGLVSFPAGQPRARITLTAASDPRREADQQSTLRLRPADAVEIELAVIHVTLEDDDQRAFEARLPVNTVGFVSSQVSVSESDPAAQIDILRFNPDSTSMVVGFTVEDLTATEGEDYFAPGSYSISFGPGQRSARLLVPLVQDSRAEGNEAFVLKLDVEQEGRPASVSPNIAVMIRDDER
ncbi:MAG: protein kinase [Woeseiaceae bacterium]|nr:protein kinase [Woeseiaceae bacterium]